MPHFKVSTNSHFKDLAPEFVSEQLYSIILSGSKHRESQANRVKIGDVFHMIDPKTQNYWVGQVRTDFAAATRETTFLSKENIFAKRKCPSKEYINHWKTELICSVDWQQRQLSPEIKEHLNKGFNAKTIKSVSKIDTDDEVQGEIIVWCGSN